MADVTEDLRILYRAVSRRQGKSIQYAGCVTAEEAVRLKQMGLARIVDVQTEDEADERADAGADVRAAGDTTGGTTVDAAADRQPDADSIRVSLGAAGREGEAAALSAALRLRAEDHEMLMFLSRSAESSHAAATLAAQAGFYCVLNILDGRDRYRRCETR